MTIKEIIAAIIAKEGGYVNHKADKGGPTKHGITANAYAEYFRKQADDITIAEIKSVTPALAEKIYYTLYFVRPNIINLPPLIQPIVLDMAVNHGRRGAVKILQTALYSSGYSHSKPDGLIGQQTITTSERAVAELGRYFINIIVDFRLAYYQEIINTDPSQAMARFALLTGLRESNITGFKWEQIDMQRHCAWVYADEAKGKKAIAIPLNDEAIAIIRQQIGKHDTHVFTYEGQPVTRANNHAWRKALVRARINDFRWHDLRHTWATWHVQNGTPLHVLKELGGWASLEMVLKYAHFSCKHLEGYAGNSKMNVTNLLHAIKKA